MADERPGSERTEHGAVARGLSTSIRENSSAFGFSIMITVSFGVLQTLDGPPSLLELFLFGVAAALAVGLLEAIQTRGFRARAREAPPEVKMLGTAQNFLSVAAGVGVAIAAGELFGGIPVWAATGFAAATVYVLAESLEIAAAERVQHLRGDRQAEDQEG